ncbi:hypothetical protein DFH06DRAFT_596142 [Mycena polygramma]|nr:hypothetical protein DFH06DRAFT_596142 [Mycena polygramma]
MRERRASGKEEPKRKYKSPSSVVRRTAQNGRRGSEEERAVATPHSASASFPTSITSLTGGYGVNLADGARAPQEDRVGWTGWIRDVGGERDLPKGQVRGNGGGAMTKQRQWSGNRQGAHAFPSPHPSSIHPQSAFLLCTRRPSLPPFFLHLLTSALLLLPFIPLLPHTSIDSDAGPAPSPPPPRATSSAQRTRRGEAAL